MDAHYCAAFWRYMREMAVEHRDIAVLVSMDDKHKVKVGEPGYPLAAAERGKQVIVGENLICIRFGIQYAKVNTGLISILSVPNILNPKVTTSSVPEK